MFAVHGNCWGSEEFNGFEHKVTDFRALLRCDVVVVQQLRKHSEHYHGSIACSYLDQEATRIGGDHAVHLGRVAQESD